MQLQSGQKIKLSDLFGLNTSCFSLSVLVDANFDVDVSVFAVDSGSKLISDNHMVFYNNSSTPNGDVRLKECQKNKVTFDYSLNLIDSNLEKIALVVTSESPIKNAKSITVEIIQNNGVRATYPVLLNGLGQEKAVMLLDVYVKSGVWRLGANGQGFNGGLAALVEYFGAEVGEPQNKGIDHTPTKLELQKKLVLDKVQAAEPRLVDLTKKSLISLEKNNLIGVKARVCLVLDRSDSMRGQYKHGDVQALVERIIPLAINFDDDGEVETWAFAEKPFRLDDVGLNNINNYIESSKSGWNKWGVGGKWNNEVRAIRSVVDFYQKQSSDIPTYVIFVSDGGVHDDSGIISEITRASQYPIFWQFVGIGGHSYGVLENLDTMTGRVIDNCGFFSLDNLYQVVDEKLYDMLLSEFPIWIREAKVKGILR